jgi:uncharacterized protein YecE (DUF72 family)
VITLAEFFDKALFGTSGWSYKEWIGPFYAKEDKSMLRAYSRVFKTVEIDSTFYRYPSKGTVMGWTRYSPEGFVYAAKLPGQITHEKKLSLAEGVEEDLKKFVELMEPLWLSGKLGCILIQLPPKFDYRPRELEDFFKTLPTQIRFAVEFRELSWMRPETWELLERYNVAYTIVDEPLLPPEVHLTSDIAYFRWHGKGIRPWYDYEYKVEELQPWVPKVKETAGRVKTVYGYFNNHFHGYAVENCLQVLEMLGVLSQPQAEAKKKIEHHLKTSSKQETSRLEAFLKPSQSSVEDLLRAFMDPGRLERAMSIKDEELRIENVTPQRIEATIREYRIVIDLETKEVLHDCADWSKIVPEQRFCKHLGKLLLSLDQKKADDLLKQMSSEKEKWTFKQYEAP